MHLLLATATLAWLVGWSNAFTTTTAPPLTSSETLLAGRSLIRPFQAATMATSKRATSRTTTLLKSSYVPPEETDSYAAAATATKSNKSKSLHPKVGDLVRYYDLDGGKWDGQMFVGKISYISSVVGGAKSSDESPWLVEITEMDNLGDGYYAEYPSRVNRMSKQTTRNLANISPVSASFVRSENAFKVPLIKNPTNNSTSLLIRQDTYDWEDYEGPFATSTLEDMPQINQDVIEQDYELYQSLKGKLLKYTALTGLFGTIVTNFAKGTEDAAIYFAGSIASIFYLFFLSLKTDTMANPTGPKLGSKLSNLRFGMPALVVLGVAIYNASRGENNPFYGSDNLFDTVTPEQFAAAMIGFLTYRLPLFVSQIQESFAAAAADEEMANIPGSAGIALKALRNAEQANDEGTVLTAEGDLIPVLLVSGPQATGRSELVKQLIEQGNGKFVSPIAIDRTLDPVKFEQLQKADELLPIDGGTTDNEVLRIGTTRDGILMAAAVAMEKDAAEVALAAQEESGGEPSSPSLVQPRVVVVDASVPVAKRLVNSLGSRARLIGVWVGLTSVGEFENRLESLIDNGNIDIPEDETKESVVRARIKEIVSEIEFGISAGIFEFTILNDQDDATKPLKELKDAASYCFK